MKTTFRIVSKHVPLAKDENPVWLLLYVIAQLRLSDDLLRTFLHTVYFGMMLHSPLFGLLVSSDILDCLKGADTHTVLSRKEGKTFLMVQLDEVFGVDFFDDLRRNSGDIDQVDEFYKHLDSLGLYETFATIVIEEGK